MSTATAVRGRRARIERLLPSAEAYDLLELVEEFSAKELAPIVDAHERAGKYPEGLFRSLGELGLLGLPFGEEWGGGEQPYEVYLQVLEELARTWASVAVAVSVHTMATSAVIAHGDDELRARFVPALLDGSTVAAYSLSEPHAGSDVSALACRAVAGPDGYRVTGEKSWITHGGVADAYVLFTRTAPGAGGVTAFVAPRDLDGLTFSTPLEKMGLSAIPTASAYLSDALIDRSLRLGEEGKGLSIALGALDSGRLGIAAVATGLAQGALDAALDYATEREAFGKPIIAHQGLGFLLADMAAAVDSARSAYVDAARRRDRGMPFTRHAAVAKLTATDSAMRVTTDAVQVLGGAGYTREFPVERYMREAKVMQIFEGTNQIQRLVISRSLGAR
ncbi:acyl-CoA dehydrogenase family protein [Microbacterium sp. NPDC089320]|uniref:acyl-CoA dehydrogenase family protein n=1 Tax=Microbacterium sp. NPDC089320 TaxID=3155182 RepID=UPI00341A4191